MKRYIATVLFVCTLWPLSAAAAPALRYQTDIHGNFEMIGAPIGYNCEDANRVPPVVGTIGAYGNNYTDTGADIFWRSTNTGAAASNAIALADARTTAKLNLPSGAIVHKAYLYWAGNTDTSGEIDTTATITFVADNGTLYANAATATASFTQNNTYYFYESVADVTTFISDHKSGAYRVSDITTRNFVNLTSEATSAGWWLIVLYELATDPLRNLAVFDGLDLVQGNNVAVSATLTGFEVPNAGFDAKLAVVALEGDTSITGDSFRFNGNLLSNASNPSNNFFNATRSAMGSPLTVVGDLPQLAGTAGSEGNMDFDIVDVKSYLAVGQTSATISAQSSQDWFWLGFFATSISTYRPDYSSSVKTAVDINGGSLVAGDILEYTITSTNTGNDASINTVLRDSLPTQVTYVPNSLQIVSGANAGAKTDATGDDQGYYTSATRTVYVNLGTGATAAQGGLMNIGDTSVVRFHVQINAGVTGQINNQAIIVSNGAQGAPQEDTPTDGNGGDPGVPPTETVVDECIDDSGCISPEPYCDTTVSPKVCVVCLVDANCGGATPYCDPATLICVSCVQTGSPPGTEACDGIDNDCDGLFDEGLTQNTYYRDVDGDAYGDPGNTIQACAAPAGYVANSSDCDDTNNAIKPGATEICNGVDDDCDGPVDEGLATYTYYQDADGDTYGNAAIPLYICLASPPAGFVANSTDCNDSNNAVYPTRVEVCNTIDDDCDGAIDEGTGFVYYRDADGDTYGNAAVTVRTCVAGAPAGYVSNSTDCDDTRNLVNPGRPDETTVATGRCDGLDNDCDGLIDENRTQNTYYRDADGDGYGDAANTDTGCAAPPGYVSNSTDCNDADNTKYQLLSSYRDADLDTYTTGAAQNVCSGATRPSGWRAAANGNDCNDADNTVWQSQTGYQDIDGDTYTIGPVQTFCTNGTLPTGYRAASAGTDCNDNNAAIRPGATELCNGTDDDCDLVVDDGLTLTTYYLDGDGDGRGDVNYSTTACSQPLGYVANSTDCNDNNGSIYQNLSGYVDADLDGYGTGTVQTVCSGVSLPSGYSANNTDCNDGDNSRYQNLTGYADADSDTYTVGGAQTVCSGASLPTGYQASQSATSDCNDAVAAVNPGATETCNGIDDNCVGGVDENLGSTTCGVGVCQVTVQNCVGGVPQTCTSGSPTGTDQNCNGIDEDCSGTADDHYVADSSCFLPGACAAGNVASSCVAGVETGCATGTPAGTDASCDGIDNNCNGAVDEGYVADSSCFLPGACAAGNVASSCVAGVETGCATGTPAGTDASCDGIDNNCNGAVDEGYVADSSCFLPGACAAGNVASSCVAGVETGCATGTPAGTDASCDGIDNNCNGAVDEGYVADSSCFLPGACAAGNVASSCVAGVETGCATGTPAGTDASCDGIDNNCNGAVDEGYVADSSCFLPGACAAGNVASSCVAGVETGCATGTPAGTDASCDGIDNNCNGAVDEGYVADSSCFLPGACAAGNVASSCVAGVETGCATGTPAGTDASCDGIDNNCNGAVDEGYVADSSCFLPGACAAGNVASSCVAGVETGCATGTPAGTDASCDGIDNNCNGAVDEGYVADSSCFLPGACAAGNVASSCVAGVETGCATGTPAGTDASCDGIDNNCNGAVDEGYVADSSCFLPGACAAGNVASSCVAGVETGCATGTPAGTDASCDGIDNNCNGAVDEGYVADSSCFLPGACAAGNVASSCVAGVETGCATGTPAGTDASCDGIDNNCNGAVDEGYVADSSCFLPGACAAGNVASSCVAGVETGCATGTPAGTDASCDGIDNNCNGAVDEGYVADSSCFLPGACAAGNVASSCVAGVETGCATGTPAGTDASCDGIDNNCNGAVDEGYVADSSCFLPGACAAGNVASSCVAGVETGCATGTPAGTDASCDGIDNNCNGAVDEGYVADSSCFLPGACAAGNVASSCVAGVETGCATGTPAGTDASCDGIDNNCNGAVDEGYVADSSCFLPGACAAGNVASSCVAGVETGCATGTPAGTDASCDGIDNNCNGAVDEGYVADSSCFLPGACAAGNVASSCVAGVETGCATGTPAGTDASCDGIDNNCNGAVDEGYVADSSCFLPGACAAGNVASSCVAGVETGCATGTPAGTDASCDGIDNNCNGAVDEGYVADSSCFLPGACAAGNVASSCVAGVETGCATGTPAGTDASCDGIDNNCNGAVDEGYVADSSCFLPGACAAGNVASSCVAGVETGCATGTPAGTDASCDGIDNNCNGAVDEGYVADSSCFLPGACAAGNVASSCVAGVETGCATGTPAGTDASCDGIDNNCNGAVDEGYVADSSCFLPGACAAGNVASSCVAGVETGCATGTPAGTDASCDGIDNNCNGAVDEGYVADSSCFLPGACAAGNVASSCVAGVETGCATGTPAGTDASCDGIDNNCNGAVDEGYVADSSCFLPGACAAGNVASSCVAGVETGCATGTPAGTDASCDGIDNNCNGAVDEGYVADSSCFLPGACAAGNVASSCVAGVETGCATGTPAGTDASCDGIDNNCNGAVDEGYVADSSCFLPGACAAGNVASSCVAGVETGCATGTPAGTDASCDGIDNNCNGAVDEGYVADSSCFLPGACAAGNVASSCVAGVETGCATGTPAGTDASCDGIDNNCNGAVDEGYVADSSCFLPGACAAGNVASSCVAGVETGCATGTPAGTDASCDGIDNNCNGAVDEGYVADSSCFLPGACAAGNVASSCVAGVETGCATGTPAGTDASCDGIDNNCNGAVDEGYVADSSCFLPGACAAGNVASSCVAGVETGCATGTPAGTDASCDGIDNNCNGAVDEGYVADSSCFLPGACAAGNVASSCVAGVETGCATGTPAGTDASCDGIDNNCNGAVDEGYVADSSCFLPGACAAGNVASSCVAGVETGCATGTPAGTDASCDGIDNNCNGAVDEGYVADSSCFLPGACAAGNVASSCVAGVETGCATGTPAGTDASCDGIDNNCNGAVDEGYVADSSCFLPGACAAGNVASSCVAGVETGCATGTPAGTDASCDGIDNNCNGAVDEGYVADSSCFLPGACAAGNVASSCVAGVETGCATGTPAGTDASCDGIDNNCNGAVDEGYVADSSCFLPGACAAGNVASSCVAGVETGCATGTPAGTDASCDGIDNNCNGAVDEGYVADSSCFLPGACAAGNVASSCVAGVETGCATGTPAGTDASCDGIDNNCNGAVDEGYVADSSCFLPGACAAGNVASSCVAGVETGCATGTPAGTDASCDGIDNNCNGAVDEGYVADSSCFLPGACAAGNVASSCVAGVETGCATGTPAGTDASCDGIDNNCNGAVDEGYVADSSCFLPGACAAGNVASSCVAGVETGCATGTPAGTDASCDGIDNNCNGAVDEGYVADSSCFLPGACAAGNAASSCVAGVETGCATGTPAGTDASCDGIDNNCNGAVDEGYVADSSCFLPGACAAGNAASSCVAGVETGCATGTPAGTDASCDGIDNNCNGAVDEGYVADSSCFLPGACAAGNAASSCVAGVETGCATGTPAGTDASCDGIDNNCNGAVDEGYVADSSCFLPGACAAGNAASSCVAGVETGCATGTPAGTDASCDGIDNNCNGAVDEGYVADSSCFLPGACAAGNAASSCVAGVETGCATGTPAGTDASCDGIDNNCNGAVDEGYVADSSCFLPGACAAGNAASSCVAGVETGCATGTPAGTDASCNNVDDDCNGAVDEDYVADSSCFLPGACAAGNAASSCVAGVETGCATGTPAGSEVCNGLDDNCDGQTDEGLPLVTYYLDADSDSYGDPDNTTLACAAPAGYVSDSLDCNDDNALINPAAEEVCNGIDDNCNVQIDEGLPQSTYYRDADYDGFGDFDNTTTACAEPAGYVSDNSDCDDSNILINPDAVEICNGIDDNCNDVVDEGCIVPTTTTTIVPCTTTTIPVCIDEDGDGYGDGAGCLAADCDDDDPDVYEGCTTCAVKVFPRTISKALCMIKPIAGFYMRGQEDATFSKYTEIAWETDAIKTIARIPLGRKNKLIFVMVLVKPRLLEIREEYKVHVGGCIGKITVK